MFICFAFNKCKVYCDNSFSFSIILIEVFVYFLCTKKRGKQKIETKKKKMKKENKQIIDQIHLKLV